MNYSLTEDTRRVAISKAMHQFPVQIATKMATQQRPVSFPFSLLHFLIALIAVSTANLTSSLNSLEFARSTTDVGLFP